MPSPSREKASFSSRQKEEKKKRISNLLSPPCSSNKLLPSLGESLLQRPMESELRSHCHSESLSEEGLRAIIQRHGLTPNNSHDVKDYDFFIEACFNERVTERIIQCLLEYFPAAISANNNNGSSPLHCVCKNPNVTLEIIQVLINADPASVRRENNYGITPLHVICGNRKADKQILELLLEKCPEAVRHANNRGELPIYIAALFRSSPEFCRVLIEAYPGSEGIASNNGAMPLHCACYNNVTVVEYLYNLYPDAIHRATTYGEYPIHAAVQGINFLDKPPADIEIVRFLLASDPGVKLQKYYGESLLRFACRQKYGDADINAALEMIKVIYDSNPEAIEDKKILLNIQKYHQEVQVFVHIQLAYTRQAKVHRQMKTPDMSGQLPLHTALRNNSVSFGSIRLLVKGNPDAVQSADNIGALPLHIACTHYESVNAIQYLVELDATTLDAVDRDGNTALHLLCGGARYDVIALLLDEFDEVSVSTRNKDGKLPIDLLWDSDAVKDRGCIEYTESMYRLLRANPEMIMGIDSQTQSYASILTLPCQSGKKRKLGQ